MLRTILMLAVTTLFLASPAVGQTLSERMTHVANKRTKAQARKTDKAFMLSRLMHTNLSIEFNETEARDAFDYLASLLGINMVVRYNDDRVGVGIDPTTPLTLTVENEPALTILELMLSRCEDDSDDCTWQLRDGYVEVGTKDRLSVRSAQEVRYYPIRDLLIEPLQFNNAPELDISAALNQGGGSGGGGGGGGGFGGSGGGGGDGSGGSSGGGGIIFDPPAAPPDRLIEAEKAEQIILLIEDTVEPDAWTNRTATIRYHQGILVIRAPDFIHRQLGGYPYVTRQIARNVSNAPTP